MPTFLIIQSFDAPVNETSLLSKAHCNMSELFDTEILIIPAKDKCAIREELDFFNINEATLFPELEHQMAYIKQKSVPTNGIVPTFKKYVKQMEIFSETVSNVNPDLEKIIKTQFADLSIPIQEILIDEIGTQLALIDWKQKTSIKSQIRSTAKRIIQQELSAIESNYRAEKLLEILLNPTDEFAKNEVTI